MLDLSQQGVWFGENYVLFLIGIDECIVLEEEAKGVLYDAAPAGEQGVAGDGIGDIYFAGLSKAGELLFAAVFKPVDSWCGVDEVKIHCCIS